MTEGYRNYRALATELGLGNEFVPSSPVIGMVRGGKLIDIDARRPVAAAFTPALSWSAKLKLMLGIWKLRKSFVGVDSFRLVESADFDSETENAEMFARPIFGDEVTDYLLDPLIRLTTGSGAAKASRLGLLGALVNWSVPLMNIRGGLDVLPLALAQRLDVTTGIEVERVDESATGVDIGYRDAQGGHQVLHADVCVIATTHEVSEAIYPSLRDWVPGYLDKIEYVRQLSISLAYDVPTNSKAYAVMTPTVESSDLSLIFLQHNKAPDRVPPGCSLITIYTDTLAMPRMMPMSDAEAEAWGREAVERWCPELRGHFRFSSISRWPLTGYLAIPGFWLRTRALLAAIRETTRVQIAGDLFGAGSMESAVTWGEQAARRLIAHHAKQSQGHVE
jgi:predicted NAD/FAD-dependent oxidoreductase